VWEAKRRQAPYTPNRPHLSAADGPVDGENCGVGFAIPEMKKAAETSAGVGNNPHSYPEGRLPNEV